MGGGGGGSNAITFPSNPTSGDTYTYQGKLYTYSGAYWFISKDSEILSRATTGSDAGLVFTSNGAGNIPSFQALSYLPPTAVSVSSDITLAKGNRYFVDTSAARTLTLPASPTMGDEIQIFDATGTAATNKITVANNSLKINGATDSALLDVNGVAAVFIYTGSTYGWRMG